MSCVLRFRGNRLILAMAFSVGMTCATGAMARGQMREVVRQAISHAKGPLEQLSRLGDGKVQIKALCAVAGLACIVNFSAPAAADFSGLQSDASLSKSRGMSSIFAKGTGYEKSLADESGFEGSWWLGYGIYKDDGGNLGAARIGVNGKHPNFSLYFTASERHHPDMTDGFDGIGLKVRTFGGGSGMLIKNREGEPSFGYGSVDLFTSDKLSILDFQAYLGHYSKGPFQVAAGGMEYMDKELDAVEGADSVRGVYASLYRASYSNTYTTPQGIDITFKASSVLGLGDMGVVELARFWQGEMNEFAGNADLDPAAYHKGSASIGLVSKDGRVALSIGGEYGTTIAGEIDMPGEGEDGEFTLDRRTLSLRSSIELIPEHNVRFESLFDWYWQGEYAKLAGDEIDRISKGIWGRFALVKSF